MRLPNKLFSFNESIFALFPDILSELKKSPLKPFELYKCIADINLTATTPTNEDTSIRSNLNEFLDALDALYALHAIKYDEQSQKLVYLGGEKDVN